MSRTLMRRFHSQAKRLLPRRLGFSLSKWLRSEDPRNSATRLFTAQPDNQQAPIAWKPLPVDVLRRLPKAELHYHFDGSVPVQTVWDLAQEGNIELPATSVEELREKIVMPEDCASLVDYLKVFPLVGSVLQTREGIIRAFHDQCEALVADGVRYVETRFCPALHTEKGMSLEEVMDAICHARNMVDQTMPITPQIIVCGLSMYAPKRNVELAHLAVAYQNQGVVAFDLAGPEAGYPREHHADAFMVAREGGLGLTCHAGEADGAAYVKAAVDKCFATRIGHGVRAIEDLKLVGELKNRNITVEVCVTSNIQTKAVASLDEHPVKVYHTNGLKVVPCTDNSVISDTTLTAEYDKVQHLCQMSPAEVVRMIDQGFASAFIPEEARNDMRWGATKTITELLLKEGIDMVQDDKEYPLASWLHNIRPKRKNSPAASALYDEVETLRSNQNALRERIQKLEAKLARAKAEGGAKKKKRGGGSSSSSSDSD